MQQLIGKTLGAYQLVEQIGQGGMATVYKAYQPSMDRYVAVKVLPSYFSEDRTFMARFTQEARTLARLEHPHILPVHDYGEQEGVTYLVMRYFEAGTLKGLIERQGALELKEAARIMSQVGSALDYAHSQGVIHRDIKPTNVLIDRRGDAFLTDFGIAKLVAESARYTATGTIVGTPTYMSPEQGMAQAVDQRSDIYSLGVVLYELVTGRVPFDAETPLAVLLQHINAPLPPPRLIKPDLPEAVERVILKAMSKAPDDRFQHAQDMVDALQKAVTGTVVESAVPQPVARPREVSVAEKAARVPLEGPTVTAPLRPAAAPPSRRALPWLPIVGGAAVVVALLIGALLVLRGGGGGETAATPTGGARDTAAETLALAQPTAAETAVPLEPGWTSYSNGNFVSALARQDDYLWAGGEGGLVRWNLTDSSSVKFGVTDGLASGTVNDLLVDGEGVLWVATDAGINRFDGQTWLTFDEADGLDAARIRALLLDSEGGLWAASADGERGLNYYDGTSWGAPPIPPLPVEYPGITALAQVGGGDLVTEGGLAVGMEGNGLAGWSGLGWELATSADALPSDNVIDLLWTEGALWISLDNGVVLAEEANEPESVPQLAEAVVWAMRQTRDGAIWFAGEGGAARFDPGTGDWQRFEPDPGPIPAWLVTDIAEDEAGVWLSTMGGGVAFYDGSRWETYRTDDALGGNVIEAILEDQGGGLWFSHPDTGLSRYDPRQDSWQVFGEEEGALNWPSVPALDSQGHLWIGGYGELLRYDGSVWQRFTPGELTDIEVYAVEIGPDDVQWLLTGGGLMRRDPATDALTPFSASDHPALREPWVVETFSDGSVWAGGADGLARYDGSGWNTPTAVGTSPEMNVDAIAEAPDGSAWVSADGQLFHLVGDRWDRYVWPGDGWIERMAVAPDGSVWAGFDGLGHLDPGTGDWQIFTPADGLIHSRVQAIHVTAEGVVWIGTHGGVSRYVPGD